jgi:hypothetical protein
MLELTIRAYTLYDDEANEFIEVPERTVQLEHSLLSISRWESKWNKPFLTDEPKTDAEIIDYIKCMMITKNIPDVAYSAITMEQYKLINDYISAKMTVTTIYDREPGKGKNEVMTSELIYYYMIACNIPFECEKWHLNRLMTLIKVCGVKNDPNPKKQSITDTMKNNAALNAARRKKMNSKG